MLSDGDLLKIIQSQKLIAPKIFEAAISDAKKQGVLLEEFLISKKLIAADKLYQEAANFYGLPFILLQNKLVPAEVLNLIPLNLASKHQLAVFEKSEGQLSIGTCLPPDLQTIEFIKRKENLSIKLFFTTPESVNSVVNQYRKDVGAEVSKIKIDKETLNVVDMVQGLVENAIREGASDIHVEPKTDKSLVRYRIDGVLREIISLPEEFHAGVVARIKILSRLKVDEHRLPQDGRFNMDGPGYKVSIRVSVVPLMEGEKIVLRILHQEARVLTLEELGMQPSQRAIVEEEIKKSQGMILSVGPTGCGKTTTLYTLLSMVNKPGVNILTIEDPIEYSIPGINQSQVNAQIGYTFAKGLRAFLRQDPNVIMVGEIRDQETAEIALHAALTGHLVFSTLHTNDAVTTLPRLREMGIPPYLVAYTVNVVVAQRLARKICPHCKEKVLASASAIREIEKQLNVNIEELSEKYHLSSKQQFIYKGKGCKLCRFEGLKGRIGIFEVLRNTPEIYLSILSGATSAEIAKVAQKQNMLTLIEDGFLKIFQGLITLEELMRVV